MAHLARGRCMLSLDTSGKSLHKRGYREQGHPAPLKETLAASILILAGYDGTQTFLDPMCGSGTIAVEAALREVPHLVVSRHGNSVVARTVLGRGERVLIGGHLDTVPEAGNGTAHLRDGVLPRMERLGLRSPARPDA